MQSLSATGNGMRDGPYLKFVTEKSEIKNSGRQLSHPVFLLSTSLGVTVTVRREIFINLNQKERQRNTLTYT